MTDLERELYEALRDLREHITAASLVRNQVGRQVRKQADAALAKAANKDARKEKDCG